jgi:hypothetical protein
VAELLRSLPQTDVELVDGDRGEFLVAVNGHEVARKTGENLPTETEIVEAVRRAAPVPEIITR